MNFGRSDLYSALCALCSVMCIDLYAIDPPTFSEMHGYKDAPFTLSLECATEGAVIYYTTDCSTPSASNGMPYTGPLTVDGNTTLRAVAVGEDGESSVTTTATYLFVDEVLRQDNKPAGYPSKWGPYASTWGTAIADYEIDPEMTSDKSMADSIARSLLSLPVLSVVTDCGYLFSDEKDEERGGIYIYTGGDASSTGNGYGDGWLRPASVEFWEQDDYSDGFQVNCAIKIHGNASRMAEKTPKHSFRMKMKSDYGPKKLHYKMFGKGGGKKFNQLVLRAGFGNTWLHWLTSQQKQAMFTRDAWAKRMMKSMGHLAAGTRFAHLYLNGMYWGMYNPTERIDADFCELHLGGTAEEYDVVRFDDGHLNTVDGTLDDYERLLSSVANSSNYQVYQKARGLDTAGDSLDAGDVLLDVDNFIDFMLVNYYGGNGDWDHHNWVAVHRRGANEGFRWLPWDSELVLQGVNDNIMNVRNKSCPTDIFRTLMEKSPAFKLAFVDRAFRALSEPFGILQPDSVQAVWEQLTGEIDMAIWAEAARWGDYRRDVHPYQSRGSLYTKHSHFDPQCEKMRSTYFPQRTGITLQQLQNADLWTTVKSAPVFNIDGEEMAVANAIVTSEQQITMRTSYQTYYTTDGSDPIKFSQTGTARKNPAAKSYGGAFSVSESCTIKARYYNGTKGWGPLRERRLTVLNTDGIIPAPATVADDHYYDLQGRRVLHPKSGIYIHHGRKVMVK